MTTKNATEVGTPCKEMIAEIIEDGQKLRSLTQLMDHYNLKELLEEREEND